MRLAGGDKINQIFKVAQQEIYIENARDNASIGSQIVAKSVDTFKLIRKALKHPRFPRVYTGLIMMIFFFYIHLIGGIVFYDDLIKDYNNKQTVQNSLTNNFCNLQSTFINLSTTSIESTVISNSFYFERDKKIFGGREFTEARELLINYQKEDIEFLRKYASSYQKTLDSSDQITWEIRDALYN